MRLLSIAGLIVVLAACAPRKPPAPPPSPPAPPPPTGKTSYQWVFDPASPANALPADVKFFRPIPVDQRTLPEYPAEALAAHDGPHREVVRIIVDRAGLVSKVGDSPLGASDRGEHAAAFRTAVDAAVHQWRFKPGVLYKTVPGNDVDGDGKPDYDVTTSTEIVPVYYDVKFTFEIVDGRGVVTRN